MKNQQLNLTKDPIPYLAVKMAIPVSIGFLFHTMFNVVDTYFASKISSVAVAAITITFPIFFMIIAISSGTRQGATAPIANAEGANNKELAKKYLIQTVSFSIILALVIMVIGLISAPYLFKLMHAKGEYYCVLNPDTLVSENTFITLLTYIEDHPQVGCIGPKILNSDGTLQLSSKRSFPHPMAAFFKLTGLSALLPKSRLFGRYNLTYLDEDKIHNVDALSGSFMLFPRKIFEIVGKFDQSFFMYGEDLDYCYRIQKCGYDLVYNRQCRSYTHISTRPVHNLYNCNSAYPDRYSPTVNRLYAYDWMDRLPNPDRTTN